MSSYFPHHISFPHDHRLRQALHIFLWKFPVPWGFLGPNNANSSSQDPISTSLTRLLALWPCSSLCNNLLKVRCSERKSCGIRCDWWGGLAVLPHLRYPDSIQRAEACMDFFFLFLADVSHCFIRAHFAYRGCHPVMLPPTCTWGVWNPNAIFHVLFKKVLFKWFLHGAWTHDPEMKSCTLLWLSRPSALHILLILCLSTVSLTFSYLMHLLDPILSSSIVTSSPCYFSLKLENVIIIALISSSLSKISNQ